MAIVRLMETEYTVEETGDVTILAVVESPTGSSDCPVGFGFEVRILTVLGAGTAGIVTQPFSVCFHHFPHCPTPSLSIQNITEIMMRWTYIFRSSHADSMPMLMYPFEMTT